MLLLFAWWLAASLALSQWNGPQVGWENGITLAPDNSCQANCN
jgi:hypothetical protein